MGLEDGYFWALDHIVKKFDGNKLKSANFCDIKWASFSNMIDRSTKNPGLDKLVSVIDKLDDHEFVSFVKEMRPHISWAMSEPGYREVKAYNIIGAHTLADLEQPDRNGHSRLLFTLRIPEQFFPSDFAVLFSGNSMDKIIPDKAAAGVTLEYDTRTGEIYLCELPVEGLTFKRVIYHPDADRFEFKAETKSGDGIPSHFYDVETGKKYIVGKLTWVASRK